MVDLLGDATTPLRASGNSIVTTSAVAMLGSVAAISGLALAARNAEQPLGSLAAWRDAVRRRAR